MGVKGNFKEYTVIVNFPRKLHNPNIKPISIYIYTYVYIYVYSYRYMPPIVVAISFSVIPI